MRKPRASEAAWAGLVAGVGIYDYMSPDGETLSERLWDAQDTKKSKSCLRKVKKHMISCMKRHTTSPEMS